MSTQKYKVLVVEDSDDDFMLLELDLRRTGLIETFEIVGRCQTGEQAIAYFTRPASMVNGNSAAQIVLLDIKLPGRDGFDVLRAIRERDQQCVVGIFTSSVLEEEQEKAFELGADMFQTKNIRPGGVFTVLAFSREARR